MSSCESESQIPSNSSRSESDFSEKDISIMEHEDGHTQDTTKETDSEDEYAYADEPLADEEWLAEYNREMKAVEEQEAELKQRLEGSVTVNSWCKCGNCSIENVQNISECYCCAELDGCGEALNSDKVQNDVGDEPLQCILSHPGFAPVCLEKWSLILAADRYNTKNKTRYRQTGSEEGFLRSIAYRQFTRLVYGFLGNKRIPLPACAYNAIRNKFKADEEFTGFELDD